MSRETTRKRTDEGEALALRLGRSVVRLREARGLTQEDLAEHLGVDPKSVARIERGAVLPSLQRVMEISDALGVTLGQLLGEASTRDHDLADWLAKKIKRLKDEDRSRIVDLIERLGR